MSCSTTHVLDFGGDPLTQLIGDLDEICGMCDGEGLVANPARVQWNVLHANCNLVRTGRWEEEMITYCKDHDYVTMPPQGLECKGCRGIGRVPTDAGIAILSFLQRHQSR